MAARIKKTNGESARHAELKRLAILWAQSQGYLACAAEVRLPNCPYRADVAAFRLAGKNAGAFAQSTERHFAATAITAVFECKQTLCDLRRDNCHTEAARQRLQRIIQRRQSLEACLRTHYPSLRSAESLFPEFDPRNFAAIGHRGYDRLARQLRALQTRLADCAKFEKLVRWRCANLFFLVLPEALFRDSEVPAGWGVLVEFHGGLALRREPAWHETTSESQVRLLHRIALAGTRLPNRKLKISPDCASTTTRLQPVADSGRHSGLTPAPANCVQSFPWAAAGPKETAGWAPHRPKCHPHIEISPRRWRHR